MKILLFSYLSIKSLKIRLSNFKVSFFCLFDKGSFINKCSRVSRFCVLRNSYLDAYSYVAANSNLVNCRVGKFCSISKNVTIGAPVHPKNFISSSPIFYSDNNALHTKWVKGKFFSDESPLTIVGNDVWIGMNATVMGGCKIGNGAILAAHSVVTKDVPAYAIVAGVPARVIRYRFTETQINVLEKSKWWLIKPAILKNNIRLFSMEMNDDIVNLLSGISNDKSI